MRRLLALTCTMVVVDTLFYTAIGPLVPLLSRTLGLSKAGVGVVSGAFGAGAIAGAVLSAYLVGRIGVRPVAVAGLLALSASGLAFGLGDGFWTLTLARFGAGVSSALSWGAAFAWLVSVTPEERRGRAIGTLFGTAVFGAVAGPALGGLAAAVGLAPAFAGVAAAAALVGLWALLEPTPAPGPSETRLSVGTLRRVLEPPLPTGLWLVALGPFLLGVLVVLAPLELDRLGWGAQAVGAVFLLAALAEAVAHPLLGRWSDESGFRTPVRLALLANALVLLALPLAAGSAWSFALLVVLAGAASNATVTPGTALFSGGAEKAGADRGTTFGAVNLAWSAGYAIGAPFAGALAGASGDRASYLCAGAVCLLTLLLIRRSL
jgi:predicted MFS family arabinose efflux permease